MRNLLMLLTLGTLLLLPACGSDGPFRKATVPEPGPTGLDQQQFEDIPVPRGFRLLTKRSFSYQSSDLRLGQFVYEGTRLSPRNSLLHYEREMVRPLYGWSLTEANHETRTLTFSKGGDRARVHCKTERDATRVTIDVNYEDSATRTDS